MPVISRLLKPSLKPICCVVNPEGCPKAMEVAGMNTARIQRAQLALLMFRPLLWVRMGGIGLCLPAAAGLPMRMYTTWAKAESTVAAGENHILHAVKAGRSLRVQYPLVFQRRMDADEYRWPA